MQSIDKSTIGRILILTLNVALLSGCYTAQPGDRPGRFRRADAMLGSEMLARGDRTAFDGAQHLLVSAHRRVLRTVRHPGGAAVVVYVDGIRVAGLERLRLVATGDVESIRYMSRFDANFRFGGGHEGGAILVRTRHR